MHVVFRCEADETIGVGHLARCSHIALALRTRGITTRLVSSIAGGAALDPYLRRFDLVEPVVPGEPLGLSMIDGPVVVDDYALLDQLAAVMNPASMPDLMVIDDGLGRFLPASVVVNPNPTATAEGYEGAVTVHAGSTYALLHPELRARRPPDPVPDEARRILVTCGAADAAGLTERYLAGLADLETAVEVRVLVGPLNTRHEELGIAARKVGAEKVTGGMDVHGPWADIALTALGTTAAELACLGVPNIATAVHPLQMPHLSAYAEAGFVHGLGWHEDLAVGDIANAVANLAASPKRRALMREHGMSEVDGLGAERVAAFLAPST